eukprot:TRINITY_DN5491_c0_g1_i3.p1 TRINITY_DN5491_c0_g1~~TRINITY_DN5491_c0_g1_i3.p1  ORF type:complete len:135 (-),score=19.47 TRINITY_DN5491_c0_g1_i3:314-718(-)
MECPDGIEPVHSVRVWGVGVGLFIVLLLGTASVLGLAIFSCAARTFHQGPVIIVFLLNVVLLLLLWLIPKEGPCPKPVVHETFNRQGQFLDVTLLVGALAVLGAVATAGIEFTVKPVYAVPRDERLAGKRTAAA